MIKTRCPSCKGKLAQGQRIHPECVDAWAAQQQAKAERKQVKAAKLAKSAELRNDKAKAEAMKTKPELTKEAQTAFNAYIRARDAGKPCICCGKPLAQSSVGGGFDAGHYRSVGSAPHLRFNEDNCHGQTKQCNRWGAGRAVDYRIGLIERIGLARVEALESDNKPKLYTHDDLRHIRDSYKLKLKEMKKWIKSR